MYLGIGYVIRIISLVGIYEPWTDEKYDIVTSHKNRACRIWGVTKVLHYGTVNYPNNGSLGYFL